VSATLSFFDASGRAVQRRVVEVKHDIVVDLKGLPAGLYVARVRAADRSAETKLLLLPD